MILNLATESKTINTDNELSPLLAGPILRHCTDTQVTIWLVTKAAYRLTLSLSHQQTTFFDQTLDSLSLEQIQVGEQAFINLINVNLSTALPKDVLVEYDIRLFNQAGEAVLTLSQDQPEYLYAHEQRPSFAIKPQIKQIYHGSCRKPHFAGDDGLIQLDNQLATQQFLAENRPSLLMLSGDQVYVDDVAGPMLVAIHQVINLLGLFDEHWEVDHHCQHSITNSQQLYHHPLNLYCRDQLLPKRGINSTLMNQLFGATKQPIFTSVNAKNHLVTLSEIIAMYLLVWSPTLWHYIDISPETVTDIPAAFYNKYCEEYQTILHFIEGLTAVQRAMVHVPTYMIFDDHDITDDWNLTRGWEEAAYGQPMSKRMIGNALTGYYLCQGWGNQPTKFDEIKEQHSCYFTDNGIKQHDELVAQLLAFDQWHYELNTTPKMVVLDTRTQRWRSESNAGKPSGLMDWESLTELQTKLINEPCVIMVSAAPIYGLKFIETVQRVFTFFGKPLAVDAENWMAHKGTANVMLNIFRNRQTPPQFIILSGDVHYSFVYDISHRFIRSSSSIVQITCSGIKNEFPEKLLHLLERLNYYLYGTYSPLNWFTKRRRMKIKVRRPDIKNRSIKKSTTLYNGSGIGVMKISENFQQIEASILTSKGERVTFERSEETTQ